MPLYCAVPNCKEKSGFRFPTDPVVRKEWSIAIKRVEPGTDKLWEPTQYSVVCANHFKPSDFKEPMNSLVGLGARKRRDLKKGAIPSIFEHSREARRSEAQVRQAEERSLRAERRAEEPAEGEAPRQDVEHDQSSQEDVQIEVSYQNLVCIVT